MAQCNYCSFHSSVRNAEEKGMNWRSSKKNNFYEFPKHIDWDKLSPRQKGEYFCAWFERIPDHCTC